MINGTRKGFSTPSKHCFSPTNISFHLFLSRRWETLNLSTDAASSTDTIFLLLSFFGLKFFVDGSQNFNFFLEWADSVKIKNLPPSKSVAGVVVKY